MLIAVYSMCAATAAAIALLLLRSWWSGRAALQLYGGLCFVGLTAVNVLVVVDKALVPGNALWPVRLWITLAAVALLLYGMIFRER